jgi:hypothetical protein
VFLLLTFDANEKKQKPTEEFLECTIKFCFSYLIWVIYAMRENPKAREAKNSQASDSKKVHKLDQLKENERNISTCLPATGYDL